MHEAAHQKKWHGFCNWCDWNAGPVPWVDLQKQRLQHAYDTGGDPNSPEGQGGHVSVVSDVPHPLSLVDGKRYPITYVPFRPGDETAQAVRARYPGVAVMHNGDHIGQVEWHPEDHPTRGSEVSWIDVDPEYQRHGIATSLFDWAKEHVNPALHHSDYQTAQGEEWLNHLGSADGIRYAAVVDADVAEDMRRLAMPAPMPEGITFHYHPTDDTIPTKPWPPDPDIYAPSFSAPAVEARHHGQTIGFLEWDPPLHSTTIDGVQYGDYPPEISMIKVHRDYRRHGVATAMFDFARRHQGDLNHSPEKTAQGEAWAGYEQSRTTRLAMPAPTSLRFTSEDHEWEGKPDGRTVSAHDEGRDDPIGYLRTGINPDGDEYIEMIHVDDRYKRHGVGRAMWEHAGRPLHAPEAERLPEGLAWSRAVGGDAVNRTAMAAARLAAVTQDLVDSLDRQFHGWWTDTFAARHRAGAPEVKSYLEYGDPDRGPITHWPAIEAFLKERYPAAHKGHDMGLEEAGHILDGRKPMPYQQKGTADLTPYETGPEAETTHGYDPKEIAAGMLLLHNKSHPFRGDMAWHDQERLNDIYTKRRQMQRDYERRTKVLPGTIIGRRVVARAPWNPAGGPLWRGMRVRWSPEELVRLHELHDSDDHETLAHTILDRVQHGSTVGEWHQPREGRGGLGVFWSGSPDVSRAYSHHGDGHDPGEAGPFENVVVQTDGYAPADEWTPYDEDVPHDWEPNDFLNADRETDLREGAPLGVTHVHVNAPGGPLSIPLTRPRRMTATFPNRDADGDPSTAQRHALAQMLHLQHYAQNGVHPKIGGFDPGETVATHPAAHHPLMTNHWAAEVMHPQPVSGPFGLRVQGSTGRYVNALIGVHQNGPQHDGGGTGRRLEDASNELRVELQHSDHISVPDLSEFSPLVVPGHASLLAAVNPRFDHGLPGNSSGARAAYQTNCQRAVLALDARHRGLNVEARPNFHEPGNLLSDEQWTDSDLADFWRDGKNHPATWIDAEDHFQFTPPGPGWWDAMDEEIASWGPQARALVAVTQADPNNPGVPARHVIYAHGSRRGKVNYADPQIAKADASDWRDRVLYGGHPLLFTTQQRDEAAARTNNPHARKIVRNRLYSPLRFMRIDDKNLDPRAARHLVDRGTAGHRPIVPWPASSMIVQ